MSGSGTGLGVRSAAIGATATDGTLLEGTILEPASSRPCAVLITHGVASDHRGGVARWLGPLLATAGFTVLSLDRRDRGTGPITATFDDGLADIATAVDVLTGRGHARIVLCGHSKGTVYLPTFEATRERRDIVGLALFATMHDNHAVARDVLWPDDFPAALRDAARRLESGDDEPFPVDGTPGSPTISPSAFLSFFGADTPAAPVRSITGVRVPTLLCRVDSDSFAPASFQRAVANAGRSAGVAISELTMTAPGSTPSAAHRFDGVEDETAHRVTEWIERVVLRADSQH